MTTLNDNALLREQLGKNKVDVITTSAMSNKNYYAIFFPVESVINTLDATNVVTSGGSSINPLLNQAIAAGTTIFLQVRAITLESGIALCYYEQGY